MRTNSIVSIVVLQNNIQWLLFISTSFMMQNSWLRLQKIFEHIQTSFEFVGNSLVTIGNCLIRQHAFAFFVFSFFEDKDSYVIG